MIKVASMVRGRQMSCSMPRQAEPGRAKQRQGVRVGSKIKQNEKY